MNKDFLSLYSLISFQSLLKCSPNPYFEKHIGCLIISVISDRTFLFFLILFSSYRELNSCSLSPHKKLDKKGMPTSTIATRKKSTPKRLVSIFWLLFYCLHFSDSRYCVYTFYILFHFSTLNLYFLYSTNHHYTYYKQWQASPTYA